MQCYAGALIETNNLHVVVHLIGGRECIALAFVFLVICGKRGTVELHNMPHAAGFVPP